jgi:hypothetical protein
MIFSIDGKYTVTAIVTGKDGTVETLTETIDAKEPQKPTESTIFMHVKMV